MSIARGVVPFIVAVALTVACNPVEAIDASDKAVARFHDLYNSDDFATIYREATTDFQNSATEAKLVALLQAIKRKIGKVESSQRQGFSVNSTTSSGTTANVTYATKFERGQATETFRFRIDGKTATLLFFNVNSADLIIN
jgi:hypothetical protein